MILAPLIRDLAIILGVAGLVTLLFQVIKQPVVLGYVLAGFLVGPYAFKKGLVQDLPNIHTLADLGVIFVMFSLGLEFSFRKLARVGISSGLTAVFEVSLMFIVGFGMGRLIGWNAMDSTFLAAMLAISSTTVIVKTLDDLKLKTRRFSEVVFGVLIVEDLAAILLLVVLSSLAMAKSFSTLFLVVSGAKLLFVIGAWVLTGYFLVPRLVKLVGKVGNDEMLIVLATGLCLLLVVLAAELKYSVALGAFIMGSILAETTESHRIEELIRPLRDVFAAVFFVSVGMLFDPLAFKDHFGIVFLLVATVIIGKFSFASLGALLTGQTLRTSIQVGCTLTQIGEFSFIIAGLGRYLGVTSDFIYSVAVSVAILTTMTTPWLTRRSHRLAVKIEGILPYSVKHGLMKYASWMQNRRASTDLKNEFYTRVLQWILNGVMVGVVFVLVGELGVPLLTKLMNSIPSDVIGVRGWARMNLQGQVLVWVSGAACFFLAAPFVWGMFIAFRDFSFDKSAFGGTLFVSRIATALVLGILSLEFVSLKLAVVLTAVLAVVVCALFYRRLEATYQWIESKFLSTFQDTPKSPKRTDVLRDLAPWDAHLVRLKVHPNSSLVGKTLLESDLRGRMGLNVVVISRGLKTLVAPSPKEYIFPKDELLVLGDDDQIDSARSIIEKPPGLSDRFRPLSGYQLRAFRVDGESSLVGKSIRDAGIRENYGAMVVGLEREGNRQINPASDLILLEGDMLWVVGEAERLREF